MEQYRRNFPKYFNIFNKLRFALDFLGNILYNLTMKKILKSCACVCGALALSLSFSGCEKADRDDLSSFPDRSYFSSGSTQLPLEYTVFNVDAVLVLNADFSKKSTYNAGKKLWTDVVEFLGELESSLSTSVSTSCISAFNNAAAGESVELDYTAYTVLSKAMDMYTLTEGYYNPGVYYSVDLYGFAPRASTTTLEYDRVKQRGDDGLTYYPLPDEEYVTAFNELSTHFGEVSLFEKDGKYYATKPENGVVTVKGVTYSLKIDLGGIGKGYAADVVNELMDAAGFEYGYFSFGTSSISFNKYTSEKPTFSLASSNPRYKYGVNSQYFLVRTLSDVCTSSSGDDEQYYFVDGKRYCHIIDPTTGSPVDTGIIASNVIGGTAAEGDALTTALMAMGKDKAIEFINEKLSSYIVTFVCEEGDGSLGFVTNTKEEGYTLADKSFNLLSQIDENGKVVLK
jgi:thiamine biosynthesis lipoprotein